MIDVDTKLLLFINDFTGRGADVFYWFLDGRLEETDSKDVVSFPGKVVCHDFWIIRDALFNKTGTIPNTIVDLDEFRLSTSGIPEDRLAREKHDFTTQLGQYGADQELCDTYKRMFNKGVPFEEGVAAKAAMFMAAMYLDLRERASSNGELERFFNIEVPVYRVLQLAMTAGISIDTAGLSEKRAQAEHEYFLSLKDYSEKHDMPLETPSRRSIEQKLLREDFELDEVSVEYLLEFVPHERDFGGDTMALIALDTARRVLGSLTLSSDITRPVVDVFGSRTSRVQLRNPSLQNIPKRYRSIIGPHEGAKLSYVDFDQFEVGIMAALSGDEELKRLFAAGDMYSLFASEHLGLVDNRKAAKQLFLSYAYGMSRKALVDAAQSLGVERPKAKAAFQLFQQYEDWKKSIWADFQRTGRVSTIFGNHYQRTGEGQLNSKEQRSVVSQVVQGTASLIFKRALLTVAVMDDVRVILPMHDALLFEHTVNGTPANVVDAFERVMTEVLDGRVTGKASVSDFADRESSVAGIGSATF